MKTKAKLPASVDYMNPHMRRCPVCDRMHHNKHPRNRCHRCAGEKP